MPMRRAEPCQDESSAVVAVSDSILENVERFVHLSLSWFTDWIDADLISIFRKSCATIEHDLELINPIRVDPANGI